MTRQRIMLSSINQIREIREKMYTLYFKSEAERDQLRFSEDVIPRWCLSFTHYLGERRAAAYSQLLNVFCSFSSGEDRFNAFSAVCTFSLLLFLFTCLLAYLLFAFSLPCSGSENCRMNDNNCTGHSFTNKSLFSFHSSYPFSSTWWHFLKDHACSNKM